MTFEQYRASKNFPALDGLRAVAIFLVFSIHFGGELWAPLSGWLGVHVFFVLSGYLITTLLLRECDRTGTISLRAFYIRRVFRILPIYFLVYVFVMFQSYMAHDDSWVNMKAASPYYLTFLNEFAPLAPLKMTWTLGIEWKFYFVWPALIASVGVAAFSRIALVLLSIAALGVSWWTGFHIDLLNPFHYQVMLMGAGVAVVLHYRTTYAFAHVLMSNAAGLILLAVLCVIHWKSVELDHHIGEAQLVVLYGFIVALLMPNLIAGTLWTEILGSRPFTFVGHRSYSMYLIELVGAQATMGIFPQIHFGPLFMPICFFMSLMAADGLHRFIEKPMTKIGHTLANSKRQSLPLSA
jgi:peptidoglycan/LPS O-acetylase OafA/YrhL